MDPAVYRLSDARAGREREHRTNATAPPGQRLPPTAPSHSASRRRGDLHNTPISRASSIAAPDASVTRAPTQPANSPARKYPIGVTPRNITTYTDMTLPRRPFGTSAWRREFALAVLRIMQSPAIPNKDIVSGNEVES